MQNDFVRIDGYIDDKIMNNYSSFQSYLAYDKNVFILKNLAKQYNFLIHFNIDYYDKIQTYITVTYEQAGICVMPFVMDDKNLLIYDTYDTHAQLIRYTKNSDQYFDYVLNAFAGTGQAMFINFANEYEKMFPNASKEMLLIDIDLQYDENN